MSGRFNRDIHHRRSIRLQNYDYSSEGAYFVTICARNRENIFTSFEGNVGAGLAPAQDQKIIPKLTNIGKIINKHWNSIPKEYENAEIDEFMIMPNHIHGIIIITSEKTVSRKKRAPARSAPTLCDIIGAFKSKCANEYLKAIYSNGINDIARIWQRNYHEHIIRNEKELYKIRKYIQDNPLNWAEDKDNLDNIKL